MKWELVSKEAELWRCKVFGGWIVRHFQMYSINIIEKGVIGREGHAPLNAAVAITYIPDPNHEWVIEPEDESSTNIIDLPSPN